MRKTFSLPVAATAAGGGPTPPPPADTVDNIEHSVRFNRADSAHLTRTISGSSNTYTVSMWVKRHAISTSGVYQYLFSTDSCGLAWQDTDTLYIFNGSVVNSTAVFRDPSAWYHVCISVDNLSADVYVNGVEVMSNVTMLALQTAISFSRYYSGAPLQHHANQSLANIHVIDGYAKLPGDFTFTDSNGVLQPKAYTGSYGTNGAHLDFADTSSATALGNDVSGNNNDFTPSGLVAGPAYTANSFSTEFDGSGDYLEIPASTALGMEAEDFTYEAWVYVNETVPTNALRGLFDSRVSSATGCGIYTSANGGTTAKLVYATNSAIVASSTNTITSFVWSHVAVTRSGGTVRGFINGTLEFTVTDSRTFSSSAATYIARDLTPGYFNGKVSNARIIKGRALYTAAFTPPSTALTATDDTVLLTCQDATVRDNSNIGHSVTASGDVAVVNEGPFNGYSGEFNGSSDYLEIPASTDFSFTTAPWTFEFWVYHDDWTTGADANGFQSLIFPQQPSHPNYPIAIQVHQGRYTIVDGANYGSPWYSSYNNIGSYGTAASLNTWNHVAYTRDSSGVDRVFVNGALQFSATGKTATAASISSVCRIGRYSSFGFGGKLSNVRLTKGQALYTAAFTPPTADLTTTSQGATASNVKLLTCQNSTFIDNSPSAHTITANGDAHPVSVNPHTDKYSVTFDGTGDRLSIAASTDFDIGSAKTWECWFKLNTVSTNEFLFGSLNNHWLNIGRSGIGGLANKVGFSILDGSWNAINSTTSIVAGSWYHVAVTWDGTYAKLYLNGVLEATSADWSAKTWASNNGQPYEISGYSGEAASSIDGVISNLRITDSVLYTSNFLPSKEDLTTTSQGATASNVKLLTCQSYKIQDNSDSAHTITVNGNAAPSTVAPFVTSGAGSFDGNGDYLSTPSSSDYNLGTGDFTVECLVNFNDITSNFGYVGLVNRHNYSPAAGWGLWLESGGLLSFYLDGGLTKVTDTASVSVNKWYHVAAVRNGSTVSLYVDGQLKASTTNSSFTDASTQLNIGIANAGGAWNAPYPLNGEISNLRISKGLARYTAAFTPPTEDFDPTDQDTTFLALQGNTLDDLSGNDHAVTANGDAATSTVSPFEPVDGSDAMLDSPTNYGSGDTVRGNYCTLNPLDKATNGSAINGNVEYLSTGGYPNDINGTMAASSGKWYYEAIATNNAYGSGGPTFHAGFINLDIWDHLFDSVLYIKTGFYGYSYREGNKSVNGTSTSFATGAAIGDVIGFALDLDAGELEIYKNGTSLGVLATGLSGTFMPTVGSYTSSTGQTATVNFGQQPFKYPLAGYKSLCSTNLPTPAVADGSTAMDVALYTGTSSGAVVSTPNMSPDLVWIKDRGVTGFNHQLFDTIRGVNSSLLPNTTAAENNYNSFTSFDSTGFTVPNVNGTGANGNNHVAWTWDAGSSTVSNTDGTITSQVRANPTAGISIVTHSQGASNSTVGHGLNAVPEMIISRSRNNAGTSWVVYHAATGKDSILRLNTTDGASTVSNLWGSANPTSTVFGVGAAGSNSNNLGNVINYCFAPVEGFSAFGSYTGSTDLPFVYTGFRPRWILIKRSDLSASWHIYDTERGAYNVVTQTLAANEGTAESGFTSGYDIDLLSNGFKPRSGSSNAINTSGGTYIYAAFAEHPFKTSRAR